MAPKMVFHLSMTRTGSEAVLDSRRLKLFSGVQEYVASVGIKQTLQQTYSPEGSASCVQSFDDSLIVQFALRIAFRCVLHRCGSLDIRC